MESRGAGFAAFSGLVGAAAVEAGVAGLSALDLMIPFGVELPFVAWRVVEVEDWFTIVADGAMSTTSLPNAKKERRVDARERKLMMKCPRVDALFHSRRKGFLWEEQCVPG